MGTPLILYVLTQARLRNVCSLLKGTKALVVCGAGNPAEAAADAPPAVEATGAADVKFEPAADCVFWCGICLHLSLTTCICNACTLEYCMCMSVAQLYGLCSSQKPNQA
jgi:hypothetical protein